jgi:hypothetical protein
MGIEKLARVMQKLDLLKDSSGMVTHTQLKNAIREFVGINPATINSNINTLIELHWINPVYKIGEEFKLMESDMF